MAFRRMTIGSNEMKCTGTSGASPKYDRTFEQFAGSEQAKTPLGKLLIALTEETGWSSAYEVYANFGKEPYLCIDHPDFLTDVPLMITDAADGRLLSVRRVEDEVREHIQGSMESMEPAIRLLQGRKNNLGRTLGRITVDKARAVINTAFPEAVSLKLEHFLIGQGDLYAFGCSDATFVARQVGNDFIGGVARIPLTLSVWYNAGDGVFENQRHGLFWTELARAFAAHELGVSRNDLIGGSVHANEKRFSEWFGKWEVDPYVVVSVALTSESQEMEIIVKFGTDNLPREVLKSVMAADGS